MNYGLYMSASGVMTNLYRQDIQANNLANVNTTAFKPHIPALSQRSAEAVEDDLGYTASDELLDRLGGGVLAGPQRIDFSQGPIQRTDNPLDVALTEPERFFSVRVTNPENGQTSIELTRDGRLTTNVEGQLVTPAGHPVLNANDQPIVLPRGGGEGRIDPAGRVFAGEQPVDQIQVVTVKDPQQLRKQGENRFAFTGADPRDPIEAPRLETGAIENSGVDPTMALMNLISATKAAQGNAQMIRYHDRLMELSVNRLGRVA